MAAAKLTVAVSGINAVDNPGPGAGVARSLKEAEGLDIEVLGLAYDAMEPGIYMDWIIDRSFIMPYPSGGGEALVERLLYIKQNFGLDVVIPNLDSELPVYIKYARDLEKAGIKSFLPTRKQFQLRGKDNLPDLAKAIEVDVPETRVVSSPDRLIPCLEELQLPVMVKGTFYKAKRAYTRQEAIAHFQELANEWGYPVIIQEVVTGEELNVVGVGDGEGGHLGLVGIKKSWITSQGKIWTGMTVRHDGMLKATQDLMTHTQWRGPFELECIIGSKGQIYLIEINPRFPAWSYFSTGVGHNLAANLVRKAMGDPVDIAADYEAGKLFVRYTYELVTDLTVFQKIVTRGES